MSAKEATARIKINRLLERAGWRFFGDGKQPAINKEDLPAFSMPS